MPRLERLFGGSSNFPEGNYQKRSMCTDWLNVRGRCHWWSRPLRRLLKFNCELAANQCRAPPSSLCLPPMHYWADLHRDKGSRKGRIFKAAKGCLQKGPGHIALSCSTLFKIFTRPNKYCYFLIICSFKNLKSYQRIASLLLIDDNEWTLDTPVLWYTKRKQMCTI